MASMMKKQKGSSKEDLAKKTSKTGDAQVQGAATTEEELALASADDANVALFDKEALETETELKADQGYEQESQLESEQGDSSVTFSQAEAEEGLEAESEEGEGIG